MHHLRVSAWGLDSLLRCCCTCRAAGVLGEPARPSWCSTRGPTSPRTAAGHHIDVGLTAASQSRSADPGLESCACSASPRAAARSAATSSRNILIHWCGAASASSPPLSSRVAAQRPAAQDIHIAHATERGTIKKKKHVHSHHCRSWSVAGSVPRATSAFGAAPVRRPEVCKGWSLVIALVAFISSPAWLPSPPKMKPKRKSGWDSPGRRQQVFQERRLRGSALAIELRTTCSRARRSNPNLGKAHQKLGNLFGRRTEFGSFCKDDGLAPWAWTKRLKSGCACL